MKCVVIVIGKDAEGTKLYGAVVRVSDSAADTMVTTGKAEYVAKAVWKASIKKSRADAKRYA